MSQGSFVDMGGPFAGETLRWVWFNISSWACWILTENNFLIFTCWDDGQSTFLEPNRGKDKWCWEWKRLNIQHPVYVYFFGLEWYPHPQSWAATVACRISVLTSPRNEASVSDKTWADGQIGIETYSESNLLHSCQSILSNWTLPPKCPMVPDVPSS